MLTVGRWLASAIRWLLRDPDMDRGSWLEVALVAFVVGYAVFLRALGSKFGLPFFHHWDEGFIADSARHMVDVSIDQPTNYFYGAPMMRLTAYGLRLAYALHVPHDPVTDPVLARSIARVVGICISSSGVVAIYLAARFAFGRISAALAASILYALASELVINGRYGVTDASIVALTAWTMAASAAYLRRPTILLGFLAVFAAGVTFAFKLTGLAAIVFPLGTLPLRAAKGWVRARAGKSLYEPSRRTWTLSFASRALGVAALPAVFAVCLYLNPHYSIHWHDAGSEILAIMKGYRDGHDKPYYFREHGWPHLEAAIYFVVAKSTHANVWWAMGVGLVAILGVGAALVRGNVIVLLSVVHAFGVIFQMAWKNDAFLVRTYLPAVLLLCLGVASLTTEIGGIFRRFRVPWPVPLVLGGAMVIAFALRPTKDALANRRLAKDARIRALDLIAARAHTGAPVTVALTPSVENKSVAEGSHEHLKELFVRPNVDFLVPEVSSCADVERLAAPYVITASYWTRDRDGNHPFEDRWYFRECPGYRALEEFPFNEYEQNLEHSPAWAGRSAAIVLERIAAPSGGT